MGGTEAAHGLRIKGSHAHQRGLVQLSEHVGCDPKCTEWLNFKRFYNSKRHISINTPQNAPFYFKHIYVMFLATSEAVLELFFP